MRETGFRHRILCAVLTCLLVGSLLAPVLAEELEEKQNQLENIKKQMEEQGRKAAALRQKEQSIADQLRSIQRDLDSAQDQYEAVSGQLSQTESKIRANTELLARLEKKLEASNKILHKRIRDIYKNGQINYLDVLLGAQDFTDFANRFDLLKKVLAFDVNLLQTTRADRETVAKTRAKLMGDREIISVLRQTAAITKGQVESRRNERKGVLDAATNERETAERAYRELMDTSRQIEGLIKRIQAGERNVTGNTGTMIWPVSAQITSNFGWRIHPIFGTQRMHTGIDLGADYGEAVRAADGGTVIHSDWMGGYGKTIIIDHGNGMSTLYAHNSALLAEEGQNVAKGQVVSRVGSTGYSTGPHLHFEVRQGGSPVNPLNYLP